MDWDPEIDTPASVLVIGAGPAGIEAALYARFLGYEVHVVDRARVGSNLANWDSEPLIAPAAAMSNLGLAALQAQEVDMPSSESVSDCSGYLQRYLIPVAKTDLLYQSIQINSELISLSRTGFDGTSELSVEQRSELEFRALIRSQKRGEYSQVFDLVLDCSGSGSRDGLASGRGLAKGESSLPADPRKAATSGYFRGRSVNMFEEVAGTTILYGNGLEACATAQEFMTRVGGNSAARFIWLLPKSYGEERRVELEDERLLKLLELPKQLAEDAPVGVAVMECWGIEAILGTLGDADQDSGQESSLNAPWTVTVQTRPEESIELACDRFVNCQAPLPDWGFCHRLGRGHEPQSTGQDEAKQTSLKSLTPEPHYYVLGAKSVSGHADGLQLSWIQIREQIRETFGLIGGRKDLNLYESVRPQD
ncbi:MAG: NAD-binding protein [Aureliella sp.]